jgi:hypothetical protein
MMVNKTRAISKSDTKKLIRAVNRNDFWDIPTVHPDEDMGCDGKTVFIEGCADGKIHFISMWEPEKKYGIYKIFDAFRVYSRTIAENPFD